MKEQLTVRWLCSSDRPEALALNVATLQWPGIATSASHRLQYHAVCALSSLHSIDAHLINPCQAVVHFDLDAPLYCESALIAAQSKCVECHYRWVSGLWLRVGFLGGLLEASERQHLSLPHVLIHEPTQQPQVQTTT